MATTADISCSSGNQVQLWQFLLELLTDHHYRDAIRWTGTGSDFELLQPETVAEMWGRRKGNDSMNYEKMSRALLRYGYDGGIIVKVPYKRLVYCFTCDLKSLLGYSAPELKELVDEIESSVAEHTSTPPSI